MPKRKEPEVEFADVYVMSCDGRLIEQRLEQLPSKDAPKVLTVIDRIGQRRTYTHDGKMVREMVGPIPTEIPTHIPWTDCQVCCCAHPSDRVCADYRFTTDEPVAERKHHQQIARPPGYPPSPPAPPPTPTRIRGPRTV